MGSDGPPLPVTAVYVAGPPHWIDIYFDRDLEADPVLAIGNWTARHNDFTQVVASAASAVDNYVRLSVTDGAANPGVDEIAYGAAPADVIGHGTGLPAAAFANLPMV